MRKILVFIITSLCFIYAGKAQHPADSLWSVWRNTNNSDSLRYAGLYKLNQYLSRKPDTAYVLGVKYYKEALERGSKQEMADALNIIGNSFRIKAKHDTALHYYDQSLSLREEIEDKGRIYSSTLVNIGTIYMKQGNYPHALYYYRLSENAASLNGATRVLAGALNNIGIIYRIRGDLTKAINFFRKSLILKEELGDNRGMANTLSNIGAIHISLGNNEKGVEYLKRSLALQEEINDKKNMAGSLLGIGLALVDQPSKKSEALEYLTKSLKIRLEIGEVNGITNSLNGLGKFKSIQGEHVAAIDYFTRSLTLQKEVGYRIGMSGTLNMLGNEYALINKYEQAIINNRQSLEIALNIGAVEKIAKAAESLYQNYKATKQFESALEMHELFVVSRDSINSKKNQSELVRYEFEKQALSDSLKNAEAIRVQKILVENEIKKNKRSRQQAYFLYGSITILIFLLLILHNRFRIANYRKKIIEKQKIRVDQTNQELRDKNHMIQSQADEIESINKEIKSVNESLEKRVKERTEKIELQNSKLRDYAFSNSHEVRAPLSRLMGLINLWSKEENTIQERDFLVENIGKSAIELDEIVRKVNEVLKEEDSESTVPKDT